jgi:heme-degrading monooxygenase HmoA
MYARVTTVQLTPDQIDRSRPAMPDDVRQALAREPGFLGTMFLLDRQSGKAMTIGLWESEEAVQASAAGHQARLAASRSAMGVESGVEVFEVVDEVRPQG